MKDVVKEKTDRVLRLVLEEARNGSSDAATILSHIARLEAKVVHDSSRHEEAMAEAAARTAKLQARIDRDESILEARRERTRSAIKRALDILRAGLTDETGYRACIEATMQLKHELALRKGDRPLRREHRDDNHGEIVAALHAVGCVVHDSAAAGDGFPDLVVWSPFTRRYHLVEVKDGKKAPSHRRLRPTQELFFEQHKDAQEHGALRVVTCVDEALVLVGAKE